MPTRIRLQRHGRKGRPFYHIVIADGRAPRDGRFIEKIGTYNPLTKPADINLDFDRALYWLQTGAQPSDTVRAIFSYKGIVYKNHLLKGVKKGALTPEQAEEKFNLWIEDKQSKIVSKIKEGSLEQKEELKKRAAAEVKVNEDRAAELAKKHAKEAEKLAKKHAPEVVAVPEEAPEVAAIPEEAPKALAVPEEAPETVAVTEEAPEAIAVTEEAPKALEVPEEVPETVAVTDEVPEAIVVPEPPAEEKATPTE